MAVVWKIKPVGYLVNSLDHIVGANVSGVSFGAPLGAPEVLGGQTQIPRLYW